MDVYFDHAMEQWVGEYTYPDPDIPGETRRDTEWFDTRTEAIVFAETGVIE